MDFFIIAVLIGCYILLSKKLDDIKEGLVKLEKKISADKSLVHEAGEIEDLKLKNDTQIGVSSVGDQGSRSVEKVIGPTNQVTSTTFVPQSAPVSSLSQPAHVTASVTKRQVNDDLWESLRDDWPMKIGAVLLLLAVGWFVTYAFSNDWVSPVGRILLGILFGLGVMIGGTWYGKRNQSQGNILLLIGAVSIIATILAGTFLYDMFPQPIALGATALIVAAVSLTALQQNSQRLVLSALIMGGLTPLFLVEGLGKPLLFSYLFVLVGSMLIIVYRRGWRALTLWALGILASYSFLYEGFDIFTNPWGNVAVAVLFTGLFFASSMAYFISPVQKDEDDKGEIIATAATGILFLIWMIMLVPDQHLAVVLLAGMFSFVAAAYVLSQRVQNPRPMLATVATALMLLVAATYSFVEDFSGAILAIILTVEFTAVSVVAAYISKHFTPVRWLSLGSPLLMGIPMLYSLGSLERLIEAAQKREGLLGNGVDLAVFMTLALGLVCVIFGIVRYCRSNMEFEKLIKYNTVAAIVYVLLSLWFVVHFLIYNASVATMTVLIIYSIVGIATYLKATALRNNFMRMIGTGILIAVIGRLFLVEFWTMDVVQRIATFFIIGGLLVGMAVIAGRKKSESVDVEE